jgi:hypothetical protein
LAKTSAASAINPLPALRNAGRIDRGWILADRAESQAEAGAVERPIGHRHQQERDVGHDVVARNEVLIDRPDDRYGAGFVGERQVDRAKLRFRRKLRSPAPLRPDCVANERGQPVGHHVDRSARDDLVRALVDRSVAVNE